MEEIIERLTLIQYNDEPSPNNKPHPKSYEHKKY